MRTKRPTIAPASMPARLPLAGPLALALLLDRLSAPAWLWGAVFALVGIWWVGVLARWGESEPIDVAQAVQDLAVVITQQSREANQWPEEIESREVKH